MPKSSHRVIVPKTSKKQSFNSGTYCFVQHEPSTTALYFNSLCESKIVDPKSVEIKHLEAAEVTARLAQGDPNYKAIQPFPHYAFNQAFNNCHYLDSGDIELSGKESTLLYHESLGTEKEILRLIDISIRDAWLELMEGGEKFEAMIDLLMHDYRYITFLKRVNGLFSGKYGETVTRNSTFPTINH